MGDCFTELRKNLSDKITDDQIRKFLKDAEEMKSLEGNFRQRMMAKLEQERINIAKYKAERSANLLHNTERWSRMNQAAFEGKPREALIAESQGASARLARGGNRGLSVIANGIKNSILRPLESAIREIGAKEYMVAGTMDKDVAKELYELRPDGEPGKTQNSVASQIAKLFKAANDKIRLGYESAGYPIGDIPGYIVRQTHDPMKLIANKESWISSLLKNLDHEKTFGEGATEATKLKMLDKIYTDITEGRYGVKDLPVGTSDKFLSITERGAGTKLPGSRTLHFQDGEAFYNYHQEFGKGNLLETLLNTVDRDSRNIAQLQKYGTNPLDSFMADIKRMQQKYKNDPEILNTISGKNLDRLIEGYKISAGIAERVGDSIYTKMANVAKNFNNITLLGSAVTKKVTELAYGTQLLQSTLGSDFIGTTGQIMKDFFQMGLPGSEAEQGALKKLMINYIDDTNASLWTDRYGMGAQEPGMLSKASDLAYKFTGINAHTNRGRLAIAATIGRFLESQSGKEFGELSNVLRANLQRYEIGEKEWGALRKAVDTFEHDGTKAITPGALENLSGFDKKFLNQTQNKYMNLMEEMTEMSVLHSNVPTQVSLRGVVDPHSLPGMIYSVAMQYKSVAMMMFDVTQRVALSNPEAGEALLSASPLKGGPIPGGSVTRHIIPMMTLGTALYAMQDIGKRLLTGRDMPELTPVQLGKYWAGGGGAGLYADFLMGHEGISGEGLTKTAIGPTGGRIWDIADAAHELSKGNTTGAGQRLLNVGESAIPGQTIPGVRLGLDKLLFDHLHNAVDPNYLEKRETRKLKREAKR